ncbi:peptidoglycan DD-metalloendopeptidase family protein [Leeia sp. TBRC 13508]|uniref:Peptidoglycan DD-metalloendopeptidase family protein n=1 Tax=Leeia speluncae TaxID=2884804 RepID=A0ABS8D7A9_9NEIS|nr:peptidoglycan DD-metalloendopeptidase family protein [Leeia speluncae]MCB6183528.1 peptidoglycan DD-metalloendopeptidase family protein [Leeia speluncae]
MPFGVRITPTVISLSVFSISLLLTNPLALAKTAPQPAATNSQLKDSKSELNQLQQKIQSVQQAVVKSEQNQKDATDALQASEAAISNTNRKLADLADEQDDLQDQLKRLDLQSSQLNKSIQKQKAALAKKLLSQYKHGNSDSLRLLLSNTDPNKSSRDLAYLKFVAAAHQTQVKALQADIANLQQTQSDITAHKDQLNSVEQQRQAEKQQLLTEKNNRVQTLAKVSQELQQQRQQMGKLKRDEGRLTSLVDNLTKILAEQERQRQLRLKAEAAAKAKAQKLAEAQRKKAEQQAKATTGKTTKSPSSSNSKVATTETTAPANTTEKPATTVTLGVEKAQVAGSAQSLKGKLLSPVSGSPSNRFGAPRADSGVAWRGWFYPTSEGADIKSVAGGQVVYADWLRGFGNMIIVDHGNGLMSIYGSAESVIKHVGDRVDAGQTIAKAGSSGGAEKPGLYFELRYKGKAFDPAGWLRG